VARGAGLVDARKRVSSGERDAAPPIVDRALGNVLDGLASASSVWRLSVSVGSNISASSTMRGKYTVGEWNPSSRAPGDVETPHAVLVLEWGSREHALVHAHPVVGGRKCLAQTLSQPIRI